MLRVGIALLCLAIFFYSTQKNLYIPYKLRWKVWMLGLFSQGFPFAFLFWGEQAISPGLTGILNASIPIWALILSLFFLRKETVFSIQKTFGLLLGMAGIVVIFWPMLGDGIQQSSIMGSIAILLMAISYAIGALLNQHWLGKQQAITFQANLYHQHTASLVFLFIASFVFEKWPDMPLLINSCSVWFAAVYMGLFSTAMAWMIYYHLIREWGAIQASTVMYVVPVITLFWDLLFFNTYPQLSEIAGAITILIGIILIQLPGRKII